MEKINLNSLKIITKIKYIEEKTDRHIIYADTNRFALAIHYFKGPDIVGFGKIGEVIISNLKDNSIINKFSHGKWINKTTPEIVNLCTKLNQAISNEYNY